jgi:hypothetical protein
MFRQWNWADRFVSKFRAAQNDADRFDSLPFIDNESLEDFLADEDSVACLPVDPRPYGPEIQRMVVSAYIHEASSRAKPVEAA